MSRRNRDREQLIAAVVAAWNDLDSRDKPDLMLDHPALYSACAWLAACETVKAEGRARC